MTRTQKVLSLNIAADLGYSLLASRAADVFLACECYSEGRETTDRISMAKALLAVQEIFDIVSFDASNVGETTPVSQLLPLWPCLTFLQEDAGIHAPAFGAVPMPGGIRRVEY